MDAPRRSFSGFVKKKLREASLLEAYEISFEPRDFSTLGVIALRKMHGQFQGSFFSRLKDKELIAQLAQSPQKAGQSNMT